MSKAPTTDRLPPHSTEAEQGVLGCILLSPLECLAEVATRLKADKTAFYDLRHQLIFEAMLGLQDRGSRLDLITLVQELRNAKKLDDVGGMAYLNTLPDTTPSASNLDHYLAIVFDKWVLRRMIQACTHSVRRIYEHEGDVAQLVAQVQTDILELPSPSTEGAKPLRAYADALTHRIEHYARGIGTITGLPTGFRYWDRVFAGMHAGEIIILGGDPGSGKTSLAMNVAERVAVNGHNPVGVLSLEMSAEDLILRLVCARCRINFHKLRTGCARADELVVLKESLPVALNEAEAPIYIDDASGLTMFEVRARLRAMKHRYGIRLAIVDYLQLIALTKEQMYLGMAAGYADVARSLQQAAKELHIPIIVISQLSKEARKRKKGDRPKLSDFRETGAIGDVANFAGILWRAPLEADEEAALRAAIEKDPCGEHEFKVNMEVCKNKNGPSDTGMEFLFKRWCMRFEDLVYQSKEPELPTPAPAAGEERGEPTR